MCFSFFRFFLVDKNIPRPIVIQRIICIFCGKFERTMNQTNIHAARQRRTFRQRQDNGTTEKDAQSLGQAIVPRLGMN